MAAPRHDAEAVVLDFVQLGPEGGALAADFFFRRELAPDRRAPGGRQLLDIPMQSLRRNASSPSPSTGPLARVMRSQTAGRHNFNLC
jgi:hypothetical protein